VPTFGPGHLHTRFLLLFGALLLLQAWRLLLTPYGLATTWTRSSTDVAVVSAAGRGVTQDFVMGADGLDGIWLRAAPAPRPLRGQVVLTLAELGPHGAIPLIRQALDARTFDTARPLRLTIPEIPSSRGRRFRVGIRHVGHDDLVLRLHARRTDVLPASRFVVDDAERWGDLVFETSARRATLPYWKHEVLGPWPAWVQSWWFVGAVLVGWNVLLAGACAVMAGAGGRRTRAATGADVAVDGVPRRAAVLAIVAVVVGGIAVVLVPMPTHRVIQLTEHLGEASIETPGAGLHERVDVQAVGILGRAYQAIVALPPSRIAWRIDVPKGALVLGHAAMRPDVWEKESDGANLVVSVETDTERTEVARFTLVPYAIWHHRERHPMRVSLDPWAGRTVTLAFETDPERWGNAVNDVPLWLEPRIEWPRGPAWGEARIR
jgi:hypothetical protein